MIAILTSLLAMTGAHVGAVTLGGAAGTAVEAALPWVTRGMRVRKAARLANKVSRGLTGKNLQPYQREAFTRDPTLV